MPWDRPTGLDTPVSSARILLCHFNARQREVPACSCRCGDSRSEQGCHTINAGNNSAHNSVPNKTGNGIVANPSRFVFLEIEKGVLLLLAGWVAFFVVFYSWSPFVVLFLVQILLNYHTSHSPCHTLVYWSTVIHTRFEKDNILLIITTTTSHTKILKIKISRRCLQIPTSSLSLSQPRPPPSPNLMPK